MKHTPDCGVEETKGCKTIHGNIIPDPLTGLESEIFTILLEEHKQWAKILGHIFIRALQGDYEVLEIYANNMKIEFVDGEPSLKSEAIAKAEEGKD